MSCVSEGSSNLFLTATVFREEVSRFSQYGTRPVLPVRGVSDGQNKSPQRLLGACMGSLAVSYFRTGIRTIIGAKWFHGPVRDGKGWDPLAMATRHKLSSRRTAFATRRLIKRSKK